MKLGTFLDFFWWLNQVVEENLIYFFHIYVFDEIKLSLMREITQAIKSNLWEINFKQIIFEILISSRLFKTSYKK